MKKFITIIFSVLCLTNIKAQTLTTSQTWSTNAFKNQDVVIPQGVTLTINAGANIVFASGTGIRVLTSTTPGVAGGRLVLTYCKLTGGTSASTPGTQNWTGVFVIGDKTLSQGDIRMAKLTANVGNNAGEVTTIERAEFGVTNYNPLSSPNNDVPDADFNADYTGGGIIQMNQAKVKDAEWCVDMKHYQNFNKNNPIYKYNDVSYFIKCNFSKAPTLPFSWASAGLVNLHEVEGVSFRGCTFDNNWTDKYYEFRAINVIDAGVTVTRACVGFLCNSWIGNTFTNCKYGIYSDNNNNAHKIIANYNTFNNNRFGISIKGSSTPYLCRNNFSITTNNSVSHAGITLENARVYTVMENTINVTNPSSTGMVIGISANNSGDNYNEFYKNTINNANYAIYTDGVNRSLTSSETGLKILCNTMTNSVADATDIRVISGAGNLSSGVAQNQGVYSAGTQYGATNTFSGTLSSGFSINNRESGLCATCTTFNNINYYGANPPNTIYGVTMNTTATNLGCASKICDYPCITFDGPVSTFPIVKSALLATIQTSYGTPEFDRTLVEYQQLIERMIEIYSGEPENSEAELRYDLLEQVLEEAAIDGFYGAARTTGGVTPKKYFIDFHVMKSGLLMQQKKYDEAIELLSTDLTKFQLTEDGYDQISEIIEMIKIQKALYQGTKWTNINNKDLVNELANTQDVRKATSMAQYILTTQEGKYFEPVFKFEKKDLASFANSSTFTVYPNPANDILNLPINIKSARVIDLSGRLILTKDGVSTLDISSISSGNYLIQITSTDGSIRTSKFTKQ